MKENVQGPVICGRKGEGVKHTVCETAKVKVLEQFNKEITEPNMKSSQPLRLGSSKLLDAL